MGETLVALLAVVHHEILLFAVVGMAIGGLDDFILDILFLGRRYWRKLTIYSRHPRMTTASLPQSHQPGRIAIFIPAWGEAEVIGPMLRNARNSWTQGAYTIFVGAYPNDAETLDAIATVAEGDDRIIIGVNDRDGPTTKADCLNVLWRAMVREEARAGTAFKAVVLHDAEQVGTVVFSKILRKLRPFLSPAPQICAAA